MQQFFVGFSSLIYEFLPYIRALHNIMLKSIVFLREKLKNI
ncbi:protein of unknown function [Clostridium beijerinckii]|nr:protein of unknown function [Clostridium beijerinckii]